MDNNNRYPEILSDLAARAEEVLADAGLNRADAERLGRSIADRVGRDWVGQQVYFCKGMTLVERDREIYEQFDGTNYGRLAVRHNLTERQIYNIIARVRAEHVRKNQIPLFPE